MGCFVFDVLIHHVASNFTGAKGSLHDVKALNTPDVAEDENEDDCLDFFGKDEVHTTRPEPVKVEKAPKEEEEDEEELFDPLGSVR